MRRLTAGLLLLCLLVCFAGCGGGEGALTEPEEEQTVTEAPPAARLSLEGYSVVRAELPEDYEATLAVTVKNELISRGTKVLIASDWIRDTADIPAEAPEILVGRTNRAESQAVYGEGLKTDDSAVRVFETGRIVIAGGCREALERAVNMFLEAVSDGSVEQTLSLSASGKEYRVTSLTVGGIPAEKFSLCLTKSLAPDEKYAADLLTDAVSEASGVLLNTVRPADRKDGEPAVILDGSPKDGDAPANGYRIAFDGTCVRISGKNAYLVAGVRAFLKLLLPEGAAGEVACTLPAATDWVYSAPEYPPLTEFGSLPVALVDQMHACVTVVDAAPMLTGGTPVQKYTFAPKAADGFSLSGYGNRIDEARFRYSPLLNSYVLCFNSSSGYVAVAEYPSGKCLFQVSLSGYGPHCSEFLPDGRLALALSGNGNTDKSVIRVYNAVSDKRSSAYAQAMLDGAHSVLWDPLREVLWALGTKIVAAYELGTEDGVPTMKTVEYYGTTGSFGGHDMSALPGEPDRMLIAGSGAYIFDRSTGNADRTLTDAAGLSSSSTKCLCAVSNGGKLVIVRTVATDVYAAHDTDTFQLYAFDGPRLVSGLKPAVHVATFKDTAFYKARLVDPYYLFLPEN